MVFRRVVFGIVEPVRDVSRLGQQNRSVRQNRFRRRNHCRTVAERKYYAKSRVFAIECCRKLRQVELLVYLHFERTALFVARRLYPPHQIGVLGRIYPSVVNGIEARRDVLAEIFGANHHPRIDANDKKIERDSAKQKHAEIALQPEKLETRRHRKRTEQHAEPAAQKRQFGTIPAAGDKPAYKNHRAEQRDDCRIYRTVKKPFEHFRKTSSGAPAFKKNERRTRLNATPKFSAALRRT